MRTINPRSSHDIRGSPGIGKLGSSVPLKVPFWEGAVEPWSPELVELVEFAPPPPPVAEDTTCATTTKPAPTRRAVRAITKKRVGNPWLPP